jgi:hypothetical protein
VKLTIIVTTLYQLFASYTLNSEAGGNAFLRNTSKLYFHLCENLTDRFMSIRELCGKIRQLQSQKLPQAIGLVANISLPLLKISSGFYKEPFLMAVPAQSGPRSLIQFPNQFPQTIGLLGRVIRSSQGRYLNTEYTHTDIHALSWIRTHDSSVRASEDSKY